jgi:hypothetical protein
MGRPLDTAERGIRFIAFLWVSHNVMHLALYTLPALLQSRLLLRMGRPLDTAERGIRFIVFMGHILEQRLKAHPQLPGFKEVCAWAAAWSVCLCHT